MQSIVKKVTIVAHSFDCLPGHVQLSGRGKASTVRVAAMRAIQDLFCSPELKRKRPTSCKATIVIEPTEVHES